MGVSCHILKLDLSRYNFTKNQTGRTGVLFPEINDAYGFKLPNSVFTFSVIVSSVGSITVYFKYSDRTFNIVPEIPSKLLSADDLYIFNWLAFK